MILIYLDDMVVVSMDVGIIYYWSIYVNYI